MNEFIEKLIGRLEECEKEYTSEYGMIDIQIKEVFVKIRKIVNKFAEEYKPTTKSDIQEVIDNLEIYTVGRLKNARVHITVEELQNQIDTLQQLAEEYKGGWIPCSEKLPENKQKVLIWYGNGHCYRMSVATFKKGKTKEELQAMERLCIGFADQWGNNLKPYAWDGDGMMQWEGQEVIAWQPLPPDYQPKGEYMTDCIKCKHNYKPSNCEPKCNMMCDGESDFEPITNFERIKRMSKEEFAAWLTKITNDAQLDSRTKCNYQWDEWLQSEAE